MQNNKTDSQCMAAVYYYAPRSVNIGDVFYKIERADSQSFREPCRVCGGAKELTINGITFKCPCCGSEKETISIENFIVKRYRVYRLIEETNNDDWKESINRRVYFELYHKSGRGYSYWNKSTRNIKISSQDLDKLNEPYREDMSIYSIDQYIYDDYKFAVSVAAQLTKKELARLEEYNATFGTAHVANFKSENDRKSD